MDATTLDKMGHSNVVLPTQTSDVKDFYSVPLIHMDVPVLLAS